MTLRLPRFPITSPYLELLASAYSTGRPGRAGSAGRVKIQILDSGVVVRATGAASVVRLDKIALSSPLLHCFELSLAFTYWPPTPTSPPALTESTIKMAHARFPRCRSRALKIPGQPQTIQHSAVSPGSRAGGAQIAPVRQHELRVLSSGAGLGILPKR